jgi:hypothetical protein
MLGQASTIVSLFFTHGFAFTWKRYGIYIPSFLFALLAFPPVCVKLCYSFIYIFNTPRYLIHSLNRILCLNLAMLASLQLVKESFDGRFSCCSLKSTYRGILREGIHRRHCSHLPSVMSIPSDIDGKKIVLPDILWPTTAHQEYRYLF